MMVVYGIVCTCDMDRWELEEVYVSYEKAQERVEKLKKRYPDEHFFVTSKNLIQ
jgi:hypothetical protein